MPSLQGLTQSRLTCGLRLRSAAHAANPVRVSGLTAVTQRRVRHSISRLEPRGRKYPLGHRLRRQAALPVCHRFSHSAGSRVGHSIGAAHPGRAAVEHRSWSSPRPGIPETSAPCGCRGHLQAGGCRRSVGGCAGWLAWPGLDDRVLKGPLHCGSCRGVGAARPWTDPRIGGSRAHPLCHIHSRPAVGSVRARAVGSSTQPAPAERSAWCCARMLARSALHTARALGSSGSRF